MILSEAKFLVSDIPKLRERQVFLKREITYLRDFRETQKRITLNAISEWSKLNKNLREYPQELEVINSKLSSLDVVKATVLIGDYQSKVEAVEKLQKKLDTLKKALIAAKKV